jgi:hypothetical protein
MSTEKLVYIKYRNVHVVKNNYTLIQMILG